MWLRRIRYLFVLFLVSVVSVATADPSAIEAMQEYMEFAEYSDGALTPEQLANEDLSHFVIVDTRNPAQYGSGAIPGAVNIEWREILARRDEIPIGRPVLLYCDTGLLSSKAHFALRVAGYENVKVLFGGYLAWTARQNLEAEGRGGR